MKKTIFPNLNSVRFIASFLVIIHHTEQLKSLLKIPNNFDLPFVHQVGKLGVILFFTLSGFLISFLLLNERKEKGHISLKNFYIRRSLRIWPLYYFIVLISFFLFPLFPLFNIQAYTIDFNQFPLKTLIKFIFMIPNLALSNSEIIPYASQAWSIGTEEQFYLIWPFVFIIFRRKVLQAMIIIVALYIIINLTFKFIDFQSGSAFWQLFNIDCMAIGGIIAYLQFKEFRILMYLKNKPIFLITVIISILSILDGLNFGILNYEIYSLLFAIIILNLACNSEFSKILESRLLNFLGKISYGLYMFHTICIVISLKVLAFFGFTNNILIYTMILLTTIVISYFSYQYLEKPFLKMKQRY